MIIYSYLIHHGHGTDIISAKSRKGLDKVTANYCRQWWEEEIVDPVNPPNDDEECVRLYFEDNITEYTYYFEIDTNNLEE